jgi:hypothetical protein
VPVSLGSIAVNFIGEPHAVHCGPWFCVSSNGIASVRCSKFSGKPAGCFGIDGIGFNDVYLNLIALRTLEQPVFETNWPRRNTLQHHPRLATLATGPLNGGQDLLN